MKKRVVLTESQIMDVVMKSVKKILKEDDSNKITVSTDMSDKATKGLMRLIKKSNIPQIYIGRFLMVLRTAMNGESQNKQLGMIAREFEDAFFSARDYLSKFLLSDAITAIKNVEKSYNSMFTNY